MEIPAKFLGERDSRLCRCFCGSFISQADQSDSAVLRNVDLTPHRRSLVPGLRYARQNRSHRYPIPRYWGSMAGRTDPGHELRFEKGGQNVDS